MGPEQGVWHGGVMWQGLTMPTCWKKKTVQNQEWHGQLVLAKPQKQFRKHAYGRRKWGKKWYDFGNGCLIFLPTILDSNSEPFF